jgi:predicted regulator of Ras-like GTPase activity (Roadblock/LC7/MglB family)
MSFRPHLQHVCDHVEGAVACALMAIDGIEVETHLADADAAVDLRSLLVEYSGLFRTAAEAAQANQAGGLDELSVTTEKLTAVARVVTPEYFLVVALRPDGNHGKARYLLRVTAPKVKAEL